MNDNARHVPLESTRTPTTHWIDWLAGLLVFVGAVNWGLVGLMELDLVAAVFGKWPMVARAIYVVVGLAGLWMLSWAGRTPRRR